MLAEVAVVLLEVAVVLAEVALVQGEPHVLEAAIVLFGRHARSHGGASGQPLQPPPSWSNTTMPLLLTVTLTMYRAGAEDFVKTAPCGVEKGSFAMVLKSNATVTSESALYTGSRARHRVYHPTRDGSVSNQLRVATNHVFPRRQR